MSPDRARGADRSESVVRVEAGDTDPQRSPEAVRLTSALLYSSRPALSCSRRCDVAFAAPRRPRRPCCWPARPRPAPHRLGARAAAELEAEGGAVGARVGRAREPGRIDADHLGVAHEIAPALDDLHLMAALAQRLADVVAEAILEPQRARLLAPGAAEEPARRLDRRLRVEPTVDDAGHQRRLRLGLALAAHRAVDEPRTSVDQIHGGDQGVRRLLARLQAVD